MSAKTHTLRRILAFLLLLALIFSVAYVAVAAEHNCPGENCAVCRQIGQCEELLRLLLCFALVLGAAGGAKCLLRLFRRLREARIMLFTPVAFGVKLSD